MFDRCWTGPLSPVPFLREGSNGAVLLFIHLLHGHLVGLGVLGHASITPLYSPVAQKASVLLLLGHHGRKAVPGLIGGSVQFVSIHDMFLTGACIVEHLLALKALILALVLPLCESEERLLWSLPGVPVTDGLEECLVAAVGDGVVVDVVIAGSVVLFLPVVCVASVP